MDDLLLEVTLDTLLRNTDRGFQNSREDATSNVQLLNVRYTKTNGGLLVAAKARSSNQPYDLHMNLTDVEYVEEYGPGITEIKSSDGQTFFIKPFTKNNSDIEVRCTCLDFYFRFAMWNKRDGALYGTPPKPYVSKTDRAPVNPLRVSGVCKHLIKLADTLEHYKVIK